MTYDVAALRDHFPSLRSGTAHFDGPGGTQTPFEVGAAILTTLTSPLSNRGLLSPSEANAEAAVTGFRAAYADLLEPYTVTEDAKINAIYKKGMAGGRVQPNNVTPMVIVYHKKLVSDADAPKSWKALADPKWKDKIAYAAADKSGSSYTILATLLTVFGDNDAGWKVVEDIMKNAKILPSSSRVPKGVADGEYHAGLTYEDAAMRQVAGGAPVGVIYPQDGTSVPPDGNALIKGAKHPKAAKLFLDYAVSKEVMDLLAEKFSLRSARTDVNPPKGFAPLGEIKAVAYDMEWAGKNYQANIKKWQDIIVRVK